MVVPSEAIQVGPDGQQVFVVKEDKRVEVRPVTVGQTQEGEAVITKGLGGRRRWSCAKGNSCSDLDSQVDIKEAEQSRAKPKAPVGEGQRSGGARSKAKARGTRCVMNISGLFIRRPVTTTLVMLGILIFGIMGYKSLPVSDLPTVDFPTITVNANLAGRQRRDHGLFRGYAAGEKLLHHRRSRFHELDEFTWDAPKSRYSST